MNTTYACKNAGCTGSSPAVRTIFPLLIVGAFFISIHTSAHSDDNLLIVLPTLNCTEENHKKFSFDSMKDITTGAAPPPTTSACIYHSCFYRGKNKFIGG